MPITVHCAECGHKLNVPVHLSGHDVQCPQCHARVQVEGPLMPPPLMPGGATAPDSSPARVLPVTPLPPNPTAASTLPPGVALDAAHHVAIPKTLPPADPLQQTAPYLPGQHYSAPPQPGIQDAAPAAPRQSPAGGQGGVDSFGSAPATEFGTAPAGPPTGDVVTRAIRMRNKNSSVTVLVVLTLLGLMAVALAVLLLQRSRLNPPSRDVVKKLLPADVAIERLGSRKSALGYSLRLPSTFQRGVAPPTSGLPKDTKTHSWAAAEGGDDEGSFLHLILLNKAIDIQSELHSLDEIGETIAFPARINSKSGHRRIGDQDLVAVRGLLVGKKSSQPGIVYFIADGNRTLILIGAGSGVDAKDVQYLLDHAVRTIRRDS